MFEHMTMEETFVVTYVLTIFISALIAIPVYWIFEKDGNKNGT